MLLSLEQSLVFEKDSGKGDSVKIPASKYGKIIFVLLTKVIAVYVKHNPIYVQCFNFEKSLLELVEVLQYKDAGF